MADPSNSDDTIDSRDIIKRIEELGDHVDEDKPCEDACPECAELKILKALAEEAEDCADWEHGETLVRDSYFKKYAQELAEDIGAVKRDASWPNNHLDWEAAADELKADYTSVDFDGVEYWIRS